MKKNQIATICIVSFILVFSAYTAWATEAPAHSFCEIVTISAPVSAETGEGILIDVRYINVGSTGPTFIRTRDRLGNIWTRIDALHHETGDGSLGFFTSDTMPNEHYIFQVEVGYGTALDPIEITDTAVLFILNSGVSPLELGETVINLNVVFPIVALTPIIDLNICPGQTITTDILIVSLMESAPLQKISFAVTGQGGVPDLNPSFTVDGESWNRTATYDIVGGQMIIFSVTATLPIEFSAKAYKFTVTPIIREVP